MGRVVAAMASSHAFAVEDPSGWDEKRRRNRRHFGNRFGSLPPEAPQVASESTSGTSWTAWRRTR